jgi:beta-apo-4'-carotenal oxygenase
MSQIPAFEHTPLDSIPSTVKRIKASFLSHKTRPLEYRIAQLRKLYWGMQDNKDLIFEATKKDIGKSTYETYLAEFGWCVNDIVFMQKNLARFAKDEKGEDVALTNKLFAPKIRKDPMGAVLIIGYVVWSLEAL